MKVAWKILASPKENQQGSFQGTTYFTFSEAPIQSNDQNILLVFEKGMQQLLKQAYDTSYKDDALILSEAAKVVRKYIFNSNGFQFNGSLLVIASKSLCQQISNI